MGSRATAPARRGSPGTGRVRRPARGRRRVRPSTRRCRRGCARGAGRLERLRPRCRRRGQQPVNACTVWSLQALGGSWSGAISITGTPRTLRKEWRRGCGGSGATAPLGHSQEYADTTQASARTRADTNPAGRQPDTPGGTSARRARHGPTQAVAHLPQAPVQPESKDVSRQGRPHPGAATLKELPETLRISPSIRDDSARIVLPQFTPGGPTLRERTRTALAFDSPLSAVHLTGDSTRDQHGTGATEQDSRCPAPAAAVVWQ